MPLPSGTEWEIYLADDPANWADGATKQRLKDWSTRANNCYRGNDGSADSTDFTLASNGGVFDGSNDRGVSVSSNGWSGVTSCSALVVFKPTDVSSFRSMLATGSNGSLGNFGLCLGYTPGAIGVSYYANDYPSAGGTISNGTWYCLIVTKSPGPINTTTIMYLNNKVVSAVGASTGSPSIGNDNLNLLGVWTGGAYPFAGTIAAVAFWKRTLSPLEASQAYASVQSRLAASGVTLPLPSPDPLTTKWVPIWSSAGVQHVIEDEGVAVTQRSTLNFAGAGVTLSDDGAKTVITIPGGGSGTGALNYATASASAANAHTAGPSVWEDVGSMSVTVTVGASGVVICHGSAVYNMTNGSNWQYSYLRLDLDSTTQTGPLFRTQYDGIGSTTGYGTASFHHVFTGLTPGVHVIKMQWQDGGSNQDTTFYERRLTAHAIDVILSGGSGSLLVAGTDYVKPSLLDTYANIVAAAHGASENGRQAMLTDSFYTARCNGSAWQWFYNGVLVTLPPTTGWSWDNQGTATETQAGGYLYLNAPAVSGGNTRIRYRTAPVATPWSVTALFIPFVNFFANQQAGILVRGSAGTKAYLFGPSLSASNCNWQVVKINSPTSWNSTPLNLGSLVYDTAMWLRITDNGTNLVFSLSRDGIYFTALYTEARAGFLTPDQIGYFAETQSTGMNASITLISWIVS